MNSIFIPPSRISALPAQRAEVYIGGGLRADLRVLSWELAHAPHFGLACIACRAAQPSPLAAMAAGTLPPVGTALTIRPGDGSDETEFLGVVARHSLEIDSDGQLLVAEVESLLARRLSAALSRRWHFGGAGPLEAADAPCAFNMADGGRASADTLFSASR